MIVFSREEDTFGEQEVITTLPLPVAKAALEADIGHW